MLRNILAILLITGTGFAETAEPPKFYKLDFVVKEVEGGKVLNARAYSMLASTDSNSSLRTGSKVPTPTPQGGAPASFIDVGTNIDCRSIKEVQQHDLALFVTAEISSTVHDPATP